MSEKEKFNKVPKEGQLHSPSETTPEQPETTPFDVGHVSGGEYQQFASETAESKAKRKGNS